MTKQKTTADMVEEAMMEVCEAFHVGYAELFSDTRIHRVCEARFAAMALVRRRFRMSTIETGQQFGRHHTTVMSAIAAFKKFCEKDDSYRLIIAEHWPELL